MKIMNKHNEEEYEYQDISKDIAELQKNSESISKMTNEISIHIQEILEEINYLNRNILENEY